MKTLLKVSNLFIFAALFGFLLQTAAAQAIGTFSNNVSPLPAPTGYVNDYAGVIDAATKERLESQLKNYKKTSNPSVEIAVAVVETTGDRPIFDYSLAVSRGWGIGSKSSDNPGALLLIAVKDRKYFTHVSRDLEDELPDGLTGSLQRQYLVPEFKQGNYSKGIEDTIGAYIRTIEERRSGQEPTDEVQPDQTDEGFSISGSDCRGIGILALVLLVILIIIRTSGGGRKGGGGSGGGGGGSDVVIGVLGAILSGLGSGGSDSSSGGWGGGGDFGGFGGGGDFGGGGAGGSW